MEFKTSAYWIASEAGGNGNAYLAIAFALWVLTCSHHDAVLLRWLRTVAVFAVKFVKAGFAAVLPRRRRCSIWRQRRG